MNDFEICSFKFTHPCARNTHNCRHSPPVVSFEFLILLLRKDCLSWAFFLTFWRCISLSDSSPGPSPFNLSGSSWMCMAISIKRELSMTFSVKRGIAFTYQGKSLQVIFLSTEQYYLLSFVIDRGGKTARILLIPAAGALLVASK